MVWLYQDTKGITPPLEVIILWAAEKWGIPPWEVEKQCSQRWWRWFVADTNARGRARDK